MRCLKLFSLALISTLYTTSCTTEPFNESSSSNLSSFKTNNSKTITVPFKATFFTIRDYSFTPDCSASSDEGFDAPNYQSGGGDATHLGEFTTEISFCVNMSTLQYNYGSGVFVASNGDELYYNIPASGDIGQIFPVDDPFYELRFQDSFEFTGGTGRFEGASGGGYTDSWVDIFDDQGNYIAEHQTDHLFMGEITLYPGKKSDN